MNVLFGHPAGNPNSLQVALAHFEAGRLDAFCVPWMPSETSLQLLRGFPGMQSMADRLSRRRFPPLEGAPHIQGRAGEWRRMALRAVGLGDDRLSWQANDWLMRTMAREIKQSRATAVHAYEDCSLWQFDAAKRLGKACIYDLPIGYFPAWESIRRELVERYGNWLPPGGLPSSRYARPEQKRLEMELADLVLVPSDFVATTVQQYCRNRRISLAPYGIDTEDWQPPIKEPATETLTFLFVGQCSIRKGIPLLLDAWRAAALPGAKLLLVGPWQLNLAKRSALPPNVEWRSPQPKSVLRGCYQSAHVFVFPTFFEGRALVVGEAMASGLPVITTVASGAADLLEDGGGYLLPSGDLDSLVSYLRWFSNHRDKLPQMRLAARAAAERCSWTSYRRCVTAAISAL